MIFQNGPPEQVLIAVVAIIGIIVAGVILTPLVRALARRIEGKQLHPGVAAELERLQSRVAELDEVQHRLAELEERVDFSERLLTQGRDQQMVRGEQ